MDSKETLSRRDLLKQASALTLVMALSAEAARRSRRRRRRRAAHGDWGGGAGATGAVLLGSLAAIRRGGGALAGAPLRQRIAASSARTSAARWGRVW